MSKYKIIDFNKAQLKEIFSGINKNLCVELYAKPEIPASEMKILRIKMGRY